MTKEFLTNEVIRALIGIDFLNRFKTISNKYRDFDNRLSNPPIEKVKELISLFGYNRKYFKKEKFFRITDSFIAETEMFIHISVNSGDVELIWYLELRGEGIDILGPWPLIAKKLGEPERVYRPFFSNCNELEDILSVAFKMYEDFKDELLKKI